MSLADIVPVVLATRMVKAPTPFKLRRAKIAARWKAKNREHLRKYKRAWHAKRKAK